ncbi:MAG: serine/threonine-protein kinase [Arenicella sp.]|jgi:serine/threonine-protein kinase
MNLPLNQLEFLGRYKLVRELGRGGMSIVYLAEDTELGREVAIKCVDTHDKLTAKLAERLRSEAKLLAQLNHPNIVQLYDVVEQDNILGLVIEFIGGDTLTQRLKQNPSKEVKLKWLSEVAEGLASAHQKGIAHCDLKTDNILITHDNIAKIADFGIAKVKLDGYLEDDGLTRIDSVSGSYFSLSPEQATGQGVDTRTDLFSLAILIYQTLIGEHPFGDTSNKAALLQRIINQPLELSPSGQQKLGARLASLIKNLLSKKPQERLYNASEISELLRSNQEQRSANIGGDNTLEIPLQIAKIDLDKDVSTARSPWLSRLSLIAAGFLVGIVLIQLMPEKKASVSGVSYIALDEIAITAAEGFNKALLPLIKNAIRQSAEDSILGFERTGLVESKELNSTNGSYEQRANNVGVKTIVVISANCRLEKCDIKIQRRVGERMAVAKQTTLPVASNSLIEVRNAISNQLPKLFNLNESISNDKSILLSEKNYRRYLEIYTDTNTGTVAGPQQFLDIQNFISESPDFVPSYSLAYRMGNYLAINTGDKKYLHTLREIFNRASNEVLGDIQVQRRIINLSLDLGEIDKAKAAFQRLNEDVSDDLFLSEIESSIAFAENDNQKLLTLDRQNATWRPSFSNLYNLAYSEFFYGSQTKAKEALDRSLQLIPNEPYALNLLATLELASGNVLEAISAYQILLEGSSPDDSDLLSNYGVALALNGSHQEAIKSQLKAVEINPKAPLNFLNLADAYNLAGNRELANKGYMEVLRLIADDPTSAQQFSYQAQAQAHLGTLGLAVRTLKTANQKFPEYAELDYASAIVNTLAANYVSALVDVNDAISRGTAPIWFSFKWFKPLCGQALFIKAVGTATKTLCS